MRFVLASVLFLVAAPSFAQQQQGGTQRRVEALIGSLVVQNADLSARVEELNNQIADLNRKLAGAPKSDEKKPPSN